MRNIILWVLTVVFFLPGALTHAQTDFQKYAAKCVAEIASIPDFNCGEGAVIPVTVNGKLPEKYTKDMTCDRPGLLPNGTDSDGQCVPHSRVLDLSTEDAQTSVMCRQKYIRSADSMLFDEVVIVSHNKLTGATCWFQAEGTKENPLNGASVPSPQSKRAEGFWHSPEKVATAGCGNCHDNDPFMYSPFIAQVWDKVPNDPFGPYYHVGDEFGFDAWPTTTMNPEGNTCTACHRIGTDQTCGQLAEWATGISIPAGSDLRAQEFPDNHFMPPEHGLTMTAWNVIHERSVDKIRDCCVNPDQKACKISSLPKYRKSKP